MSQVCEIKNFPQIWTTNILANVGVTLFALFGILLTIFNGPKSLILTAYSLNVLIMGGLTVFFLIKMNKYKRSNPLWKELFIQMITFFIAFLIVLVILIIGIYKLQ